MTLNYKILAQDDLNDATYTNIANLIDINPTLTWGDPFKVYLSTDDGLTWASHTGPTLTSLDPTMNPMVFPKDIIYVNGKTFVSAWSSKEIGYSIDNITWSKSTIPSDSSSNLGFNLIHNGQEFIAFTNQFGSGRFYKSTDGITWEIDNTFGDALNTALMGIPVYSLQYANNKYFVLYSYIGMAKYAVSTDLLTWTQTDAFSGEATGQKLAYSGSYYLSINDVSQDPYNGNLNSPGYDTVAVSFNGTVWYTYNYANVTNAGYTHTSEPIVANNKVYFVTADRIFYDFFDSSPGMGMINATSQTLPASLTIPSLRYDSINNKFIAMDRINSSNIYTSTDAVTWTTEIGVITPDMTIVPGKDLAVSYQELNIPPVEMYTSPANTESIISSIYIARQNNQIMKYSLYVKKSNGASMFPIRFENVLSANNTDIIKTKITLSAGDSLFMVPSKKEFSYTVFGIQNS